MIPVNLQICKFANCGSTGWLRNLIRLRFMDYDTCGDESQIRVGLRADNLQLWVNRLAAGLDLIDGYGFAWSRRAELVCVQQICNSG